MTDRRNKTFTLDHYVYTNFLDLVYAPPRQSASVWIEERMAEFLQEHGIDPYPNSPKITHSKPERKPNGI